MKKKKEKIRVDCGESTVPVTDKVCRVDSLTLLGHAHIQALLQPTRLAAVPGHLVDDAHLVAVACVRHVLLDTAPEETLEDSDVDR